MLKWKRGNVLKVKMENEPKKMKVASVEDNKREIPRGLEHPQWISMSKSRGV